MADCRVAVGTLNGTPVSTASNSMFIKRNGRWQASPLTHH